MQFPEVCLFSKASAVDEILTNCQSGVCTAELRDVTQLVRGKILVFKIFALPVNGARRVGDDASDDFE